MRELSEFMNEREIFTLENHPAMTYKAIGDKFGITPERVRQIKVHALRKLKEEKRREQAEEHGQLPITITLRRKDLWVIIRGLQEHQYKLFMRDLADQRLKNQTPDPDIEQAEALIQTILKLMREG